MVCHLFNSFYRKIAKNSNCFVSAINIQIEIKPPAEKLLSFKLLSPPAKLELSCNVMLDSLIWTLKSARYWKQECKPSECSVAFKTSIETNHFFHQTKFCQNAPLLNEAYFKMPLGAWTSTWISVFWKVCITVEHKFQKISIINIKRIVRRIKDIWLTWDRILSSLFILVINYKLSFDRYFTNTYMFQNRYL